ncbi:hypothetical protein [Cylindrospermopsis raciborskii]|uniref:Uncharacterized protein n=1 Tax=Cylindrospermopsis raciborskii CENA302 TaxID=1170768 RepID=A0A9Q5QWM0_9CYAN|nr:hypothetical protein [Cylindrospermopsis raciborskii]NLQ06409.1 hypothetical protein [Cylindrospermopsis raciborskii MVCC19]OHY35372.1 hypothetical protein BCV64_03095 [Cylindrospermopsis raciborskii MVCC14]OPH09591.1 hypothetical protein CENA302_09765 [Cylindrospermopsis raciborskii CENA302]
MRNGDVTIAGHTSPGGITIRGFVTDETPFQDQAIRAPSDYAENWILQHVRIRPGLNGPSDDGLRLRYTRRAMVDHVSVGNATDEAVEIARGLNPNLSNHNGYNLSSRGYTNLEVYLHELSTKILGVGGIWGRGRNEPTAIAGYMGTSFAIANP